MSEYKDKLEHRVSNPHERLELVAGVMCRKTPGH